MKFSLARSFLLALVATVDASSSSWPNTNKADAEARRNSLRKESDGATNTGRDLSTALNCPSQYEKSISLENDLTMNYSLVIPDTVEPYGGILCVKLVSERKAWISIAVSEDNLMAGSEAIMGIPGKGVDKYAMGAGRKVNLMSDEKQKSLVNANVVQTDDGTVLTFGKLFKEQGELSINGIGLNKFLYAVGSSNNWGWHAQRGYFELDFTPPPPAFSCPTEYEASANTGNDNFSFDYTIVTSDEDSLFPHSSYEGILCAKLVYEGRGWVAFAASESENMVPSDAVIGLPIDDRKPQRYSINAYGMSGISLMPNQTLVDASIEQTGEQTVLTFGKPLKDVGGIGINTAANNFFLYAAGNSNTLGYHTTRGSFQLDLSPSVVQAASVCADFPESWTDSYGDGCSWYEKGTRCQQWGNTWDTERLWQAKQVCCVCGGGE